MKAIVTDQAALQLAFGEFASVSRELESSYNALEHQVSALSVQLAQADRELETRLKEKQCLVQRFQDLLSALPGGVIVLDGAGNVQECNPAAERLLGQPLSGRSWRDVATVAFAPAVDDGHDITLATGYRVNLSTCSLDGEPGQILLLADVTETRRLQDQAARLERLTSMGRTVAALAHQVRTPLSAALLYASGLEASPYREKILARLRDLERLVEDMLDYAKRGEFPLEPIDLMALLDALRARQLDERQAQLCVVGEGDAAAVQIRGNADALTSVLQNLLDNAWQADTDANVSLCVDARGDDSVTLSCHDTGPGIPEAVRTQIFEPFFTTRSSGTGLGLAVVRSVVEAHGGEVAIEPGGAGARFLLRLPKLTANEAVLEEI